MPDESSNLNSPAPARRAGSSRRRGRRGGRGRSPRPALAKPGVPAAEEISPAPEPVDSAASPAEHAEHAENEADSSGDFREPHTEAPADFAAPETGPVEAPVTETPAENFPAPEARPPREPQREPQREFSRDHRPERRSEPPRQRQWARPADFRPAETTAISEAVAHATKIAGALKQMIDQLDEVLELVEIAERQKLADEREIDELRRALRRIQPPRREPPPPLPSRESRRDYRDQSQRLDEPRRSQPEPREPATETSGSPPVAEGGEQPHTD